MDDETCFVPNGEIEDAEFEELSNPPSENQNPDIIELRVMR